MDDGHQNPSREEGPVAGGGRRRDPRRRVAVRRRARCSRPGPMREPLAVGLARADAVVVLLPADLAAARPGTAGRAGGPAAADRPPASPPRRRRAGPQLGFAGVGKPWKVERALQAAGCDLGRLRPLPRPRRL